MDMQLYKSEQQEWNVLFLMWKELKKYIMSI